MIQEYAAELLFRRQVIAALQAMGFDNTTDALAALKLSPVTTVQKNAMTNAKGLVVYDGDLNKLCQNTGAGWETVTSA